MNLFILLESTLDVKAALAEGTTALIAGMGTVFIVLIAISFVISLFKYFKFGEVVKHEHKEARINVIVENKAPVIQGASVVQEAPKMDDLELVAVITAAIAASLNTTTDKLQVKSFRRLNSKNGLMR